VGSWEFIVIKSTAIALAVAGLLGSGTLALAQQTAPASPPAAQAAPQSDPNQIICKTMAPPTGTRLGARRICQTQKQWDDQEALARQQLMQMQTDVGQGGGG
jgi:hypothetical protein